MTVSNYLMMSLIPLLCWGCSGLEKSESKKARRVNLVIESINRQEGETFFTIDSPQPSENQPTYPWDHKYIGSHHRISKEFFRCKGHPLNPPLKIESATQTLTYQIDCGGMGTHSLPIREGKEFIYPILINLLNEIQEKTGKRVIITSGHRCPTHNLYVDATKKNRVSKHLIGAEVDFYVEEMEYEPLTVLSVLENYYQRNSQFASLQNAGNHWANKEVIITLHPVGEQRNADNQHPYPYLTIEVRYDSDTKRAVHFSWHQGYNGFHRSG